MRDTWDISPTGVVQGGRTFTVFEPIYVTSLTHVDSAGVRASQNFAISAANDRDNARSAVHNILIADIDRDNQPPPVGTTLRFTKFRELRAGDVKGINLASVVTGNVDVARDDVTRINVFPNPYYGLNRAEISSEVRFITFNHLPASATIRIFNLAGILVRTLIKDAGTTNPTSPQHLNWDLQNDNGLPVASGIYIAYLQLRDAAGNDLGTKTLKIAIIQEQQFLRNF
jgi:hypothetical protein